MGNRADEVKRRLAASTLDPNGDVQEWFAKLALEMAEAAGARITEFRIRIYANDLGEFVPDQIVAAARRIRKEGSGFFPSIAEWRKAIVGSVDDAGLLAWNYVVQAAARVGAYSSIEIEDSTIAAAIVRTFGSWPALCATEVGPEMMVKRQEFLAALREARREQSNIKPPVRLSGLLESGSRYERKRSVWSARLMVDGMIVYEREHPALDGVDRRQLPSGGS